MSAPSSPIRINEANAEQLIKLPMIGEKRAARILRFREEVGPIDSVNTLASAAGISLQLATNIANEIDWGMPRARRHPPWLAISSLVITAGVIAFSLFDADLDRSASGSVYNASVVLILAGCGFAVADILTDASHRWAQVVHIGTLSLLACGVSLFLALLLMAALTGGDDTLSQHIFSGWRFALFVGLIIALQLGPDMTMRIIPDRAPIVSQIYDLTQLPLAVAIYVLVPIGQDDSLMEEIFCLWAGVVFVMNGRLLAKGSSSFAGMLDSEERAIIEFVDREARRSVGLLLRIAGVVLVAAGALIASTAAIDGWIRRP